MPSAIATSPVANEAMSHNSCAIPKPSIDTSDSPRTKSDSIDNTAEFDGQVNTNNEIPSQETLKKIGSFPILDQDGRSIPFKNLYTGPNVARRVLVIFIRHFYCGNCQEYIRSLTSSITPASLLRLPTPTFIAIVGCGSPSLIPMYQDATSCPFPIYADPTKKLYSELGMQRTLNLGVRPEYQRKELLTMAVASFIQSMKMMKGGKTFKGGDFQQVGGEFMFEPVNVATPIGTPEDELKQIGNGNRSGESGMLENGYVEEKRVTWCHRMRNTRDHAEIPELREVLGLDGEGVHGKCARRWRKALLQRKGTGLSAYSEKRSTSLSRKLAAMEDGGSSGRQSSEKTLDASRAER